MATTITVSEDAFLKGSDATYSDAQTGTGAVTDTSVVEVGQNTSFNVYRGGLVFDTSGLSVAVASAYLDLYIWAKDTSGGDLNLTVVSGSDLADPLVDADFQELLIIFSRP